MRYCSISTDKGQCSWTLALDQFCWVYELLPDCVLECIPDWHEFFISMCNRRQAVRNILSEERNLERSC
jgi:hypothetical protein